MTSKSTTDAANAKLISALEAEEKRLRDNEFRYAEKIKALSTLLDNERKSAERISERLRISEDSNAKWAIEREQVKLNESSRVLLQAEFQTLTKSKNELDDRNTKLSVLCSNNFRHRCCCWRKSLQLILRS